MRFICCSCSLLQFTRHPVRATGPNEGREGCSPGQAWVCCHCLFDTGTSTSMFLPWTEPTPDYGLGKGGPFCTSRKCGSGQAHWLRQRNDQAIDFVEPRSFPLDQGRKIDGGGVWALAKPARAVPLKLKLSHFFQPIPQTQEGTAQGVAGPEKRWSRGRKKEKSNSDFPNWLSH